MTLALTKISTFLDEKGHQDNYSKYETELVRNIDSVHWCESDQAYHDTTVGDGFRLEKVCQKG